MDRRNIAKLKKRSLQQGKKVKPHESTDIFTHKNKPKFSLYHIEPKYSLDSCDPDEKCSFAETLKEISGKNWMTLITKGKENGFEQLTPEQAGISNSLITPDEKIFIKRMNRRGRLLGIRKGSTYHIFRIDPKHTSYKG